LTLFSRLGVYIWFSYSKDALNAHHPQSQTHPIQTWLSKITENRPIF
jgi:hypothetical protein